MADFKYIMQGFQKDINFFDEIKEVLETEDYTSIWILTAFVNERAICNLMPSIKKSKADISFIIGIRNNVSTYQALKCLINMKVSVFVFDTARIESIFHAQYLPQKYIEDVCNDIGNIFQEEIDKVIYSYVDRTERGSAANLAELVKNKSQMIQIEMEGVYKEIERLNECIIRLERKKTSQYNPNIAVACDAEQIICCKMDKNTHKITYLSGAIEDQEIKQNVVDILEGTMPAFDLRRRKYV